MKFKEIMGTLMCFSISTFKKPWHSPALPGFLSFLRARNDDGLCKRKSGFEIYCEMASIHGFANFVGAKTWERILWCLVIALAVFMSAIVVVMSHSLNVETPIITFTESTYHPSSTIPFPAVTICNLNTISLRKSKAMAEKLLPSTHRSMQQLLHLFRVILYQSVEININPSEFTELQDILDRNNITLKSFHEQISSDCTEELLRCKWKGRIRRCSKLFRSVVTETQSKCCGFNTMLQSSSEGLEKGRVPAPFHINSCGYASGLTVLLDSQREDYMASLTMMAGYRVLIHDTQDIPSDFVEHQYVRARTETSINIVPQNTYGTDFLREESVHIRRCYFPEERHPFGKFFNYSQINCLTECREQLFIQECGCHPFNYNYWPLLNDSRSCRLEQAECIVRNKDTFHSVLTSTPAKDYYKEDRYAENFICDCFPPCSFNKYTIANVETATLNTNFYHKNQQFMKGISKRMNYTLLHVFYSDSVAHRYRTDVYENWLSFVGTFGGIAGLHMGYSFISGFEMIFFVAVRPLCNWLTKKKIQYQIKMRQKRAKIAAERTTPPSNVEKHSNDAPH